MRELLGTARLGINGDLSFVQEDEWVYPQINLHSPQGESATIFLQHMTIQDMQNLADKIKEISLLVKIIPAPEKSK